MRLANGLPIVFCIWGVGLTLDIALGSDDSGAQPDARAAADTEPS